jgi:NhaA family Na+:H+ antiporter
MQVESSSAVVVLIAAVTALVIANSGFADVYQRTLSAPLTLQVGTHTLMSVTLHQAITDGLMALFFLLVSLEIKRELIFGGLRDPRDAALPAIAAAGGMAVPALIYTCFNLGGPGAGGWGIPMATDIAFAVAVVTALGDRVPLGGRLFLLTLAIVDDLGAIVVIALAYAEDLRLPWLAAAMGTVVAALILRQARVRALLPYMFLGVTGWAALHNSGVHATLIGVIFGFLTPARPLLQPRRYRELAGRLVDDAVAGSDGGVDVCEQDVDEHRLNEIRRLSLETQSPLRRIETRLAPFVTFGIVPLFAFANAGITLPDVPLARVMLDPVTLGVALGLVLGKVVGIFTATWVTVRLGFASLPVGVTSKHLLGLAATGGIGFTVALFVANLSFTDDQSTAAAKVGILGGSVVAAVIGLLILGSERPGRSRTGGRVGRLPRRPRRRRLFG